MKMKQTLQAALKAGIGIAFAGVAALALTATTLSAAAPQGAPKATFVKGDVTAANAAGAFAKVKRNQQLEAGGVVKTGENARAELTFPDGSVVRIGPSSELKLTGAAFDGKTKAVKVETELVGGEAWAKVATLVGNDAQFKVKTQNAVAGVRGTVFRINVDKDEATVVKVYNGSVAVGGAPAFLGSGDNKDCKENPIKCSRKEIEPPQGKPITAAQFEHMLGEMMQVRIPKGKQAADVAPTPFTAEEDNKGEPEWVRWNNARDAGKDSEKSD